MLQKVPKESCTKKKFNFFLKVAVHFGNQYGSEGSCFFFYVLQADTIAIYHIGETVLSLQKATLIPGGSESLVYTTLSGGVGMLVPFTTREV